MEYKLIIDGNPKGKERPRHTSKGYTYTPQNTVNYENYVKTLFISKYGKPMHKSPMKIDIKAYYPLCKADYNKKGLNEKGKKKLLGEVKVTKKPDIDNVIKIILDSLNKVAYEDDSFITEILGSKIYSEKPRVEISLSVLG